MSHDHQNPSRQPDERSPHNEQACRQFIEAWRANSETIAAAYAALVADIGAGSAPGFAQLLKAVREHPEQFPPALPVDPQERAALSRIHRAPRSA